MMHEFSANLHHQHHHLLIDASSSSSSSSSSSLSSTSSSSYAAAAAGTSTDHAWPRSSPFTTGVGLINPISHKSDTTDHQQDHLNFLHSSWNSAAAAHPQHFPKSSTGPIISSSSPSTIEEFHSPLHLPNYNSITRNEQKDDDLISSTRLLLQTISSSGNNGHQIFPSRSALDGRFYPRSGGAFSQIYPSINISNLITYSSSSIFGASSYQDNYMDLLTLSSNRSILSSSSTTTTDHLDHNLGDVYKESGLSFGGLHDHHDSMQQYCYSSPTTQTSEAKPTSTQPAPNKKSRLEPRASSCPPFKVRKEKLGDRIAALQQLVAPFGKTDTASVLMEAIGYINFLQNQVQTLSVPYMKSSHNKPSRTKQKGTVADNGNGEANRDLRGRGLCLVPLSCMSYVASDDGGGGGVWPPPTYGGRT